MNLSNFGAVRRALYASAVLTLFAVPSVSQVVEKGRTFADLTASHPCDTGLTNRIARVTDCDAAGTIGDGGGAFQCWAYCDGSAPWADVAIGGSAGGGAATAVTGSATLPATCTEKDLYQDTDSGGTEFYVCTATNTWTKAGTGTIGGALGSTAHVATCTADTGGSTLEACNASTALFTGTWKSPNGAQSVTFDDFAILSVSAGTGPLKAGSLQMPSHLLRIVDGTDAEILMSKDVVFRWTDNASWFGGSVDVGIVREAGNTLRITDGSTGLGWVYEDGKKALATNFTNATATMANLTGLTVTLKAGRLYTFESAFYFADSTAGEGAAFDFDGGAGTATNFVANCQMFDAALLLSAESTAIATDFAAATTTGASVLRCSGSFEVNAAGTFIPRAAQNSHSSGTLTVKRGSYLNVTDASFN